MIVAKLGQGQIHFAVAIQIDGARVGYARGVFQHEVRGEMLVAVVLENKNRSDLVVVREKNAHAGHNEI